MKLDYRALGVVSLGARSLGSRLLGDVALLLGSRMSSGLSPGQRVLGSWALFAMSRMLGYRALGAVSSGARSPDSRLLGFVAWLLGARELGALISRAMGILLPSVLLFVSLSCPAGHAWVFRLFLVLGGAMHFLGWVVAVSLEHCVRGDA